MLLVKVTLKSSPIHGLGIFAAEDIAQGQIVWRFDPRLDPLIPREELPNLPEGVQAFLDMYGYVTEMNGRRWILLCGDHAVGGGYRRQNGDQNSGDDESR